MCQHCSKKSTEICYVYSLWKFNEVIRNIMEAFKHKYYKCLQYFFISHLHNFLVKHHYFNRTISSIAVVPIPAMPQNILLRGFDQSLLLAKGLERTSNLRCVPMIKRVKSKEQKKLSQEERSTNIAHALKIKNEKVLETIAQYPLIILLDDIVTTGSTLQTTFFLIKQALCIKYTQIKHIIIGMSLARID